MTQDKDIGGDSSTSNPPSIKLEAKRIKLRWDDDEGDYVARDDERKPQPSGNDQDPFAISVVRRFVPCGRTHSVVEEIHLHSPLIIKLVKSAMNEDRRVNWKADPLKFDPMTLLAYLASFKESLESLRKRHILGDNHEEAMIKHYIFFIEFLEQEYHAALQEFESLKSEEQITWKWIPGLILPGHVLFTRCTITGDPRAVRLVSMMVAEATTTDPRHLALTVEYVNVKSCRPGLAEDVVKIPQFVGTKRIRDLNAFPFELHKDRKELEANLIERGKWCWELVCEPFRHMQYNAIAYRFKDERHRKVMVKSRVMVDHEMYDMHHPQHYSSSHSLTCDLDGEEPKGDSRITLADDEYLLFSTLVYGYSLSNRAWLEFRASDAQHVDWNPNIFDTLQIDSQTKYMIRALIETQCNDEVQFDDFVLGKGRGLIFNLYGPPGVGKTLTAEATSEVTRSPLYMTGAGDLGTTASDLDSEFSKVSALADRWKAVVLIDEADVFLEQRENRDIERNALVAVFLRQLEYYTGILFLTSNRVEVFDAAMQSRIHVTLRYDALSSMSRQRLWDAFFAKLANPLRPTPEQYKFLCELQLNGREIKNIVKVSSTFALYEKRAMVFEDITRSLNILKHSSLAGGTDFLPNK
ncbi:P-loop containing nucleoside triphosphate hydrolase protein [Dendrothele bispora CBS 962.96]|uniref:P-loop containing nucleoside triphosphate hydrolase protein n=1 Tax=Dendrothele bispora (strain CBS 962.96) TaxID=1314807 RepID=A0A4S8MBV1_DENBC|nr:P-loop containing nucleoside triphosphate hydrolase protein [Dendrothele bispora CBS 962.96]